MSKPEANDDLLSALSDAAATSTKLRPAEAAPAMQFRLIREIGPKLQPPLSRPLLVACESAGDLLVLEHPADSFRLRRIAADYSASSVVMELARGRGDSELEEPSAFVADDHGNILILDSAGGSVRRFSRDGRWLETLTPLDGEGNPASGARDVAIDAAGRVVLVDTNHDRLLRASGDGVAEEIGSGELDLYEPQSLCAGPDGSLIVANTNNNVVVQLTEAGQPRVIVEGSDTLEFPSRVRLGGDKQSLAVLDRTGARVQRFDWQGNRTGYILLAANGMDLSGGTDLALDGAGQAIVINPIREAVLILGFIE